MRHLKNRLHRQAFRVRLSIGTLVASGHRLRFTRLKNWLDYNCLPLSKAGQDLSLKLPEVQALTKSRLSSLFKFSSCHANTSRAKLAISRSRCLVSLVRRPGTAQRSPGAQSHIHRLGFASREACFRGLRFSSGFLPCLSTNDRSANGDLTPLFDRNLILMLLEVLWRMRKASRMHII